MATLMPRDLDVVDPYRRPVVDGAEMEQHPIALGGIEAPAVPDDVADALADAGELRLRTERNVDGAVEDRLGARAEIPLAVEARPPLPPEVGPWIRRVHANSSVGRTFAFP